VWSALFSLVFTPHTIPLRRLSLARCSVVLAYLHWWNECLTATRGITITGSSNSALLSYHAQLDNFHLGFPCFPMRPSALTVFLRHFNSVQSTRLGSFLCLLWCESIFLTFGSLLLLLPLLILLSFWVWERKCGSLGFLMQIFRVRYFISDKSME